MSGCLDVGSVVRTGPCGRELSFGSAHGREAVAEAVCFVKSEAEEFVTRLKGLTDAELRPEDGIRFQRWITAANKIEDPQTCAEIAKAINDLHMGLTAHTIEERIPGIVPGPLYFRGVEVNTDGTSAIDAALRVVRARIAKKESGSFERISGVDPKLHPPLYALAVPRSGGALSTITA